LNLIVANSGIRERTLVSRMLRRKVCPILEEFIATKAIRRAIRPQALSMNSYAADDDSVNSSVHFEMLARSTALADLQVRNRVTGLPLTHPALRVEAGA
jgi:hypothetical protein